MAYTVVSTGVQGQVISGGGKVVAIPWAYIPHIRSDVLTVNVDRDKIYHAPAFEYTRMDEIARLDYINNVYSYYGVSWVRVPAIAAGSGCNRKQRERLPSRTVASRLQVNGSPNEKPSARMHASSAAGSYEVQARIVHQKQHEARGPLMHGHRLIAAKPHHQR